MKTINVTVSQCLSANVQIEVPDNIELTEQNLEEYVAEQIFLPSDAADAYCPDDWNVDDFCVA